MPPAKRDPAVVRLWKWLTAPMLVCGCCWQPYRDGRARACGCFIDPIDRDACGVHGR